MGISKGIYWAVISAWLTIAGENFFIVNGDFNYTEALSKSLIFLEAQRSGVLPKTHLPSWRGDSALEDGKLADVDLVGGYYDAGDNVKYGFPMAFTVTTLACSTIFYSSELNSTGELHNAETAIRWGTDYFLKASSKDNRLYVQVGDPVKDHECWMRPENMETPRTVLSIDQDTPGTEIAAETSAALAASSMVFKSTDRPYSDNLLNRSKLLFDFANLHRGTYDKECPFYCSNGDYKDELIWASTWLYMATNDSKYLKFVTEEVNSTGVAEFSWDLKYAGAQVLLSKFYFKGEKKLENYKKHADYFICHNLPESPYHEVFISPGGMINLRNGANTQYATGAALVISLYSDLLAKYNQTVQCGDKQFNSTQLMDFAKQQMDYILGNNPKGRSYMVGFGKNPPVQAHHRGASVPVLSKSEAANITCAKSFDAYFSKDAPNPNELTGAILGGPDRNDEFVDLRNNSAMTEPVTYTNSMAVGVLAKLAARGIKTSDQNAQPNEIKLNRAKLNQTV